MSEQELPEVGSVWRHNETGEVRVIVPGDGNDSDNVVYFLKAGSETLHCAKLEYWKAWEPHFTRLTPSQPLDVSRLSGPELFWLKTQLAEMQVFGPWQKVDETTWGRELAGSKRHGGMPVIITQSPDGFRWAIAVGTVGDWWREEMGGPLPTLESAQAACDAVLRKAGVLLVD